MKSRYSGVLLHIASLSGPYGCGTMGVEAVDFLKKTQKSRIFLLASSAVDHRR